MFTIDEGVSVPSRGMLGTGEALDAHTADQTQSTRREQRASRAPSPLAPRPAPPALPPASQPPETQPPHLVTQEPHSQNNSSITPVNSPSATGEWKSRRHLRELTPLACRTRRRRRLQELPETSAEGQQEGLRDRPCGLLLPGPDGAGLPVSLPVDEENVPVSAHRTSRPQKPGLGNAETKRHCSSNAHSGSSSIKMVSGKQGSDRQTF